MRKREYILLVTLLWVGVSCTHQFDGVQDNTPLGNMECLWQTLDTKYCFFEEKGVDWNQVHDQYIQPVKSLHSGDYLALFDTLASMVNRLNDGHVNIYSPFDISQCTSWYEGHPTDFAWESIKNNYLKDYRRAGAAYYSTVANGQIGYMYIPDFESAVSASNMAYILKSWKNCPGLIVDVRNNGGGDMSNAYRLAATFFDSNQTVGYWQHKNGSGHNDFSSLEAQQLTKKEMPSSWLRPMVVLCNRRTYSAANFFVSVMRYADKSVIIGDVSGGGGGMPMSYELPNGWLVRFSSIRMYDRDKQSIEPGITPDIVVHDNPKTDTDEMIEKAIEVLLTTHTP